MKFLIAGLGNIGDEYAATRHNVGFDVLDAFVANGGGGFKEEKYGAIAKAKYAGKQLIFLKPNTYMNLSGNAVRYWLQKEKISTQNLLVITDDIALEVGVLRLRGKGSAGGHNGLKNITEVLGNNNYPRLRFGVGNDYPKGMQVEFVLGRFDGADRKIIEEKIAVAGDGIKYFVRNGLSFAMNKINQKKA